MALELREIIHDRITRIIAIICLILVFFYAILRLTVFETDPLIPLLNSLYKFYLLLPEWISNTIFGLADANVRVLDHQLVFASTDYYQIKYEKYLENWHDYLLYKKWSLLVLALIWVNFSAFKRKLFYTFGFIIVHIFAVVGGLYLMGVLGPKLVDESTSFFLTPTLFGTVFFYVFVGVWVLKNRNEIRETVKKIGINWYISDNRFFEVLILLFALLILKNYLIPFLPFKPYVLFLLETSRLMASFFGYQGYIVGDQLQGLNGALALSKHCLGFVTMFIFGAMVFLTRIPDRKNITAWYLFIGLILLFVLNIARLVLVFIVAQGPDGYQRANIHHEVYNIVIYVFIFILWVIWFEFFLRRDIKGARNSAKEQ